MVKINLIGQEIVTDAKDPKLVSIFFGRSSIEKDKDRSIWTGLYLKITISSKGVTKYAFKHFGSLAYHLLFSVAF